MSSERLAEWLTTSPSYEDISKLKGMSLYIFILHSSVYAYEWVVTGSDSTRTNLKVFFLGIAGFGTL